MKASGTWVTKVRHFFARSTVAAPLAVLIVIFILLSLFVPKFFSFRSVSGIINAATLNGALAIGIAFLMISGEFDLSVGSLLAISGYIYGSFCVAGQPFLGLVSASIVPAILCAINGIILG